MSTKQRKCNLSIGLTAYGIKGFVTHVMKVKRGNHVIEKVLSGSVSYSGNLQIQNPILDDKDVYKRQLG